MSMSGSFSTPNLPGYSNNKKKPRAMKQCFSVVNGIRVEADPNERKVLNPSRSLNSSAFVSTMNDAPEPTPRSKNDMPSLTNKSAIWLNNAGHVLRFYGYYKEAVQESAAESFRVRKLQLNYHMEDGTIQVLEHAQENSCIPQGVFHKRGLIPKAGNSDGYFELQDLYIGAKISMFTRVIQIVDCDDQARNVCQITDDALDYPEDPYTTARTQFMGRETGADLSVKRNVTKSQMKKFMEASLGNTVNNKGLQSFLENDRKVLRFTGVWDDRGSMFGNRNFFTLHYYLSTNDVEVLEQHQPNSGSDPYPLLLKRNKLPRGAHVDDPNGRNDEADPSEYIHWTDLKVQSYVNVYRRKIMLIAADPFTRNFYKEMDMDQPPDIDDQFTVAPPEIPRNQIPEHSGFGSERDSLASCGALVPKPPKTEFDKQGVNLDSTVLLFAARMDTDRYDDKDRKFVIMFYVATNEIQVREPPIRNSGVVGGKFLSKRQLKRPDGTNFEASDFYAGAKVNFLSNTFIVDDVDEKTLRYMDNNVDKFPIADVNVVIGKIQKAMSDFDVSPQALFNKMDTNRDGKIGVGEFLPALIKAFKEAGFSDSSQELPGHIAITIFRNFDGDKSGSISLREFIAALE